MRGSDREIAILGAGPVGLEAALAAAEAGYRFTLYEAADTVAGHVHDWAHVRLFTPWSLNVSPRMARALEAAGKEVPGGDTCPTGGELIERLLAPVAGLPAIASRLRLATRVEAVGRQGLLKHEAIGAAERRRRPFRLLLSTPDGEEQASADAVLDCTGSYAVPNALGDGGIPAAGERRCAAAITRAIPDLASGTADGDNWAGRTVLLAGAGHSAQTAVRDLAALAERAPATRVIWALRREAPGFGALDDDPLVERAELAASAARLAGGASPAIEIRSGVVVDALRPAEGGGRIAVSLVPRDGTPGGETVEVDRVLSLTGAVGDHTLYRQLQVHECYATSGPMKLAAALLGEGSTDCLAQTSHGADTLLNPEPSFFILGSKSYGRNTTFLLRVGWEQVDDVFALLAQEAAAA